MSTSPVKLALFKLHYGILTLRSRACSCLQGFSGGEGVQGGDRSVECSLASALLKKMSMSILSMFFANQYGIHIGGYS